MTGVNGNVIMSAVSFRITPLLYLWAGQRVKMLRTPPVKRSQLKYQAKNIQIAFAIEGESMPKAKPVSLHPSTFDEAIKRLMSVDPAELRIPSKPASGSEKVTSEKHLKSG